MVSFFKDVIAPVLFAGGIILGAYSLYTSASRLPSYYLCMDFDGKSSYKVSSYDLHRNSQMVQGTGYVNGMLVNLYIPKSNLIGCVEIEYAQ